MFQLFPWCTYRTYHSGASGKSKSFSLAPAGAVKRDPKQEAYMKQRKATIKRQNAESARAQGAKAPALALQSQTI